MAESGTAPPGASSPEKPDLDKKSAQPAPGSPSREAAKDVSKAEPDGNTTDTRLAGSQQAPAGSGKEDAGDSTAAQLKSDLVRRSRRRKRHEVEVEHKTLWELQRRYSEISAAAEIYSIQVHISNQFSGLLCPVPASRSATLRHSSLKCMTVKHGHLKQSTFLLLGTFQCSFGHHPAVNDATLAYFYFPCDTLNGLQRCAFAQAQAAFPCPDARSCKLLNQDLIKDVTHLNLWKVGISIFSHSGPGCHECVIAGCSLAGSQRYNARGSWGAQDSRS